MWDIRSTTVIISEMISEVLPWSLSTFGTFYGCISFCLAGGCASLSNSGLVVNDGAFVLLIFTAVVTIVLKWAANVFSYGDVASASQVSRGFHFHITKGYLIPWCSASSRPLCTNRATKEPKNRLRRGLAPQQSRLFGLVQWRWLSVASYSATRVPSIFIFSHFCH